MQTNWTYKILEGTLEEVQNGINEISHKRTSSTVKEIHNISENKYWAMVQYCLQEEDRPNVC